MWWELSDIFPDKMGTCEIMAKPVCWCSMLKSDDLRLKTSLHRIGGVNFEICLKSKMLDI